MWSDEAELVETPHGCFRSPLCRHCGAVKVTEERRASEARRRQETAAAGPRPGPPAKPDPVPTAAPVVHDHQIQFFTEF